MYGTDEKGCLRDEKHLIRPLESTPTVQKILLRPKPVIFFEKEILLDDKLNQVGIGNHAVAGIWNGEEITGIYAVDNLINKVPITKYDLEILGLYGTAMGHLFLLKQTEQALRESEEKFKNVFENSPLGISMNEMNGNIKVNKALADMLGYTIEELQLRKWTKITSIKDLKKVEKIKNSLLLKKKYNTRYEMQFLHKKGATIWTEANTTLQRDKEGKPLFFITMINDITERKQAEQEILLAKEKAEESDRLKTSFVQNMSHEIRTPMNSIIGFSDLLEKSFDDKQLLHEYTSIIKQRGNDLLNIIDDILDIAKIESGQLPVNESDFKLSILFEEIEVLFNEYKNRLGKQHINFVINLQESISELIIATDKVKLKQILINLISNAFKFTNNGRIETGSKYSTDNSIIFYVSDTGVGIPKEKHSFIFERFMQAEYNVSKKYGGSGLGLAIVKGLLNLLGGTIWLESEPEIGTTFYFSFPYRIKDQTLKSSDNIPQNISSKPIKATILIVEDDMYNAMYLKAVFSRTNYTGIIAETGKEAVDIVLSQHIDIILMDIRLPDIQGYEVAAIIKNQKPKIKIIAQTAYAGLSERQKALDAGCDDYISKPIKMELLISRIDNLLSKIETITD